MRAEGANINLVEGPGTVIRGWASNRTQVDLAIMCPENRYDIGFNRNKDGYYTPVLEDMFRDGHLSAQPTDVSIEGASCTVSRTDAIIGRLVQRYAVINTEIEAARTGMMTTRTVDKATGQIMLECTRS